MIEENTGYTPKEMQTNIRWILRGVHFSGKPTIISDSKIKK